MNRMGFGTQARWHFNILGLSLVLLSVYCLTYRAKAYACQDSSPVRTEVKRQHSAYSVPKDLGLPNRREPGGTR